MPISSPLQYHMNDLIYYLGLAANSSSIDKRISILEATAAMAVGMTRNAKGRDERTLGMLSDIQDLMDSAILLRTRYFPAMDTNPYLVQPTRRMKIALTITESFAYFIIDEYKLVTGSLIYTKLAQLYGKQRYKGEFDQLHE